MARKGDIEIPIGVDTGGTEKAIQNGLIDPIEDAAEALEALGKVDAGKDIDRDLKRAQDATEDLDSELDKTRKSLDKLGFAGRDAGDETKRGSERAKDGIREVGREAESTAKESAASFDGSAESIGDAFQEVAANAFAGFGPAGAVAGIAAAAGIGLAVSGFDAVNEAQEASQERVSEWADKFIEAGGRVLSASQVSAAAQEIITDPERWAEAKKNAELWGVSVETAVLAAAGHTPSIDAVNGSLDEQREAFQRSTEAGKLNAEQRDEELKKLGEATGAYKRLTEEIQQGRVGADVYSESLKNLASTTAGAKTTVDEFGDSVTTLPDGKQIYIDAETGRATDNVDAIEQRIYGIQDKNVNVTVTSQALYDVMTRWDNWTPKAKTAYVNYVNNGGMNHGGL